MVAEQIQIFGMKPASMPDGTEYYQYVVCYVDNVAVAMENPKEFMDELGRRFTLKDGSVKEPDMCLGADVKNWYIAGSEEPRLDGPCHQQNIQNKPLQTL